MLTRILTVAALAAFAGLAHAQADRPKEATEMTSTDLEPRTGLPAGAKAPNAVLTDDEGNEHKLADLIAKADGPVVLLFYRGGWCPYCTKHLAELGARFDELKATGATVYAVSPESWEKLGVTEEKGKLTDIETGYTLLSDPSQKAARDYNLIFDVDADTQKKYKGYGIDLGSWNANKEWTLPVPAAFVIDKAGVIRFAHVDEDYKKRIDVDKLIEAAAKTAG